MGLLSKLTDLSGLTGNIIGNFQNAIGDVSSAINSELTNKISGDISKITGAITDASTLADKLSGTAAGTFAKVQSLLGSVGGMSGQIKSPIMATNTIDTSAMTADIAKMLEDSKIPVPSYQDYVNETSANQYLESQTKALTKIKDIETNIELITSKIGMLSSVDADYQSKFIQLNTDLSNLNKQLAAAQQAYERIIMG